MNVLQKIHAIMSEVGYVQKDDQVKFGSTNYKALSEEKVTTIMHEKIVKYGLVVYPFKQEHHREGQITHVDVTYRIVNKDDPQDFIDVVSCGDGADTQDKGSGKAMTYSYKYMWLRAFALPSGEDPDKISSAQLDAEQAKAAEKTAAKAQGRLTVKEFFNGEVESFCAKNGKDTAKCTAWLEQQMQKPYAQFTDADYNRALDILYALGNKK